MVKLEKWVHPEFVHGIASGAPVPLKGAAVLRVTLLEGKTLEEARAGPEIFVRCKIAARGSSDWHGLILGGRALAPHPHPHPNPPSFPHPTTPRQHHDPTAHPPNRLPAHVHAYHIYHI